MKKIVRNLMLLALVLGVTFACSDDDVNKVAVEDVAEYLESLNPPVVEVEPEPVSFSVTEKDEIPDVCDVTSTWSVSGEIKGDSALVDAIEKAEIFATFNDETSESDDSVSDAKLIAEVVAADFETNSAGNKTITFSATLEDVLDVMGLEAYMINITDKFNFEIVVTTDGPENPKVSFEEEVTTKSVVAETMFVGDYYMEQIAPVPFLFGQSTLTHDTVVELTANGNERTFETFSFPFWCSDPGDEIDFKFNLECDKVIVQVIDGKCGCGDEGYFAPATVPATVDLTDDSVFEMTFTGDATEACEDSAGVQVTYRFTKSVPVKPAR